MYGCIVQISNVISEAAKTANLVGIFKSKISAASVVYIGTMEPSRQNTVAILMSVTRNNSNKIVEIKLGDGNPLPFSSLKNEVKKLM